MRIRHALIGILLVLFTMGIFASQASAQRFRELDRTVEGRGAITIGNRTIDDIHSLRVVMQRDGDLRLEIMDRNTRVYSGRWTRATDNRANISINNGPGNARTRATGRIEMTRLNVNVVRFRGRTGDQELRFWFDAGRNTEARYRAIRSLDATERGRGTLGLGRRETMDVTRAHVILTDRGSAEIRFTDGRTQVFRGRWTGETPHVANVKIMEGTSGTRASGTATIFLNDNRSFDKIEIDGRSEGRRFSGSFTSQAYRRDQREENREQRSGR